ncbi:MAG TPA: HD domain-containing protein [Cytophagaceae bacterium]|nr:HD domain-containing protein [Cytophagaceae bacterium]
MNKKKIFNDPVYGFINIPGELIFDIIEHPWFQRLRRIRQLGLTDLIYPGALHTRFHHAIGAMHLMGLALVNLRNKGHHVSGQELEAARIAVLLHDIGHGPFSHTLEHSLMKNVAHEKLSTFIISKLNKEFNGALTLALEIYTNKYKRKFFHQLVSGQLDIDRMDYLQRDCFFTGVSEGTIGADRIIKMLDVHNDKLVVEEKGIYSIENFLSARRLMYWQVYLHKTTVCAEKMLISIIERAKYLHRSGENIFATDALEVFLKEDVKFSDFEKVPTYLSAFTSMDDYDIWASIKMWSKHPDKILSQLCSDLLERRLFRIEIAVKDFEQGMIRKLEKNICIKLKIKEGDVRYFLLKGSVSNAAYLDKEDKINILTKTGRVVDVALASDLPNIKAISKIVKKHYLCWPKNVYL